MSDVDRYTCNCNATERGREMVRASDYDALADELAEAYRMSDGKGRLFQQAVAEGERFRAALEHIRRIAPLGEPTYPECYRRIQVIAYEALRGTERTAVQPTVRHCECLIPSRTPFNRNWCHTCGYEIRATDQTPAGPTK